MFGHNLTLLLVFLLFGSHVFGVSRNKRCIVVQKQSGTHGDSSEGDDDDRSPQPREHRPDRRRTLDPLENVHDVEVRSHPLLILIIWRGRRVRSPHYQKLRVRVIRIRDNRKGQPNRSAMEGPRPGGTAYVITVAPTPGSDTESIEISNHTIEEVFE